MKPRLDRRLSFALGAVAALGLLASCGGGVKVTSVTPENGTVAGGEDVIIRGQGFKAGVQVKFCRAEAKNVVLLGDNQIKATSPANNKGMCEITLTFDDGRAYKVANAFHYMEPGEVMKRDMLGTKGTPKAPTKK
ncbi:MAG: IPT/TIG domain-containing protein [Deltaproteobacteria bacterium]|nr:IPT/TIG domain-containing protein [Deltaproteobacteria bacterium]